MFSPYDLRSDRQVKKEEYSRDRMRALPNLPSEVVFLTDFFYFHDVLCSTSYLTYVTILNVADLSLTWG